MIITDPYYVFRLMECRGVRRAIARLVPLGLGPKKFLASRPKKGSAPLSSELTKISKNHTSPKLNEVRVRPEA